MKNSNYILLVIVISQFCCTSLWFAGNGVMNQLIETFDLQDDTLGHLTSSVQFGFISGTLLFALFTIADRFSPSKVFFMSAILGAFFNLSLIFENQILVSLLFFRFLTGFFLAGIYPVGMKIATDYYQKGLGKSLGYLVGALVLGTALPHLLKDILLNYSWKNVLISTSSLSVFGGLLMFIFVKDGPYRTQSKGLNLSSCFQVFKNIHFRKAAFGYFGHMWELYTFWTFVPILLVMYRKLHPENIFNIPILSFLIIAVGSFSCVLAGYFSQKFGVKKTAFSFLLLSCICCLVSPWMFQLQNSAFFILFLIFWGMVVIADSPLFSTLVAQNAPLKDKGTALTIVNCIGFSITIISIQIISVLQFSSNSTYIFMILALGPILGLFALGKKRLHK
ncbi:MULTISPECIES: MFS transporter [unclassified Polaribacter]|uniref:MFS transporter n=1 Tax=unclassified Polaribacter TaxID=196858 RepID=UPI0011BEE780|nr:MULTISPECIES: MFS transporter [unclassified Polaribacter]TXD51515.1 MFS transporter [Polaribacter sp. IC063]TXD58108.1 MFS transporter [Polaribacter sp. IC066]